MRIKHVRQKGRGGTAMSDVMRIAWQQPGHCMVSSAQSDLDADGRGHGDDRSSPWIGGGESQRRRRRLRVSVCVSIPSERLADCQSRSLFTTRAFAVTAEQKGKHHATIPTISSVNTSSDLHRL